MTEYMKERYHVLTVPQTKLWLISPEAKRLMASHVAKRYRQGVGIASASLRIIAHVDARGAIRELPPPHRMIELWQAENAPRPDACACHAYHDPETGAAWGEAHPGTHHPVCQFEQTSMRVFREVTRRGLERPDMMRRIREQLQR